MNKEKGEVKIRYQGKDYIARPTHEAMANIEAHLDTGILDLAARSYNQKLKLTELSAIFYFCIREGMELAPTASMPFELKEFEKFVFKSGMVNYFTACVELLRVMISGETIEELDAKNESTPVTASP